MFVSPCPYSAIHFCSLYVPFRYWNLCVPTSLRYPLRVLLMKLFEPCIFSHVVPCLLSFSNDYLALSLRSAPVCGIDSFCWSLVAFFLTSLFAYFVFQTMPCSYMSICSYSIFLSFGFTSLFELLSAHFAARSPAACSLRCAPSCGFYSFGLFSLAFFLTSLLASLVFRAMTCFSMSI